MSGKMMDVSVADLKKVDNVNRKGPNNTSSSADVLKWANALESDTTVDYQYFWSEDSMKIAAGAGNIIEMEWLWNRGCPLREDACEAAAAAGMFTALMWLRDRGCPWDARVTGEAAFYGEFAILRWLRENDCPWDNRVTIFAELAGWDNMREWAITNGCPQ